MLLSILYGGTVLLNTELEYLMWICLKLIIWGFSFMAFLGQSSSVYISSSYLLNVNCVFSFVQTNDSIILLKIQWRFFFFFFK